MTIGIMQLLAPASLTQQQTASTSVVSTKTQVNVPTLKGSQATFSSLFGEAISSTNQVHLTAPKTSIKIEDELKEVASILNKKSTKEFVNSLDIPHEDGLFMIQVGAEGKAIAFDEMLNLEDLVTVLSLDEEQLHQIVQQLLGEEKEAKDVWELLALVDVQAPLLQSKIVSALQGEEQVTPKEVKQFLQVLKLAELVGQKKDLTAPQEKLLLATKNFLTAMQTQVETILEAPELPIKTLGTIPLQGFQKVIAQIPYVQYQQATTDVVQQQSPLPQQLEQPLQQQTQQLVQVVQQQTQQPVQPLQQQTQQLVQLVQQTEQLVKPSHQQTDTDANEAVVVNTVQTKLEPVQITLPTIKSAQPEALVKEMQTIINKFQLSNAQGVTRLTLKLYPENLGTIRIELVQNDGVLTARLLASTAHGRDLLDSQVHQLKQAFAQQNIQLERLDIAQALQDADRQQRDPNFFSNFFKQQQQQEEQETKQEDEDETMSFSDYLINEEV